MKHIKSYLAVIIVSAINLLSGNDAYSQILPTDSLYLGQAVPGKFPKVFNLPVSAGKFDAERIAITNDGKEIYYSEVRNYFPITGAKIKYYKFDNDHWSGPYILFDNYIAPALSVSGDTMYLQDSVTNYQTYFSVRSGTGWSAPQRIFRGLNSAHYCQITNSGTYYISSIPNQGIGGNDWCKLNINGSDTTVISLGLPLNSGGDELDFYISRDESNIIVSISSRLYVSFRKAGDFWTYPKSLGAKINFGLGMWGTYVSPDQKYLFYTTGTKYDYSDTHVHWVRIDSLIDSLHHSNFIPYLKNYIPDQKDTVGKLFTYTIPDSIFIDDDGNHTLRYSATLSNGNPLPSWLSFDSLTRTFSGTPIATGNIYIKIKVTDTAMVSISDIFKLTIVAQPVHIDEDQGNIPNKLRLYPNYPNPFNPSTTIEFSLPENEIVSLKIYNSIGQLVTTLLDQAMYAGRHQVQWNAAEQASGAYMYYLQAGNNKISRKLLLLK